MGKNFSNVRTKNIINSMILCLLLFCVLHPIKLDASVTKNKEITINKSDQQVSPDIIQKETTFEFPPYLSLHKSAAWVHSMEYDIERNRLFNSRSNGKGLSVLDLDTKDHFSVSLTNSTEKFPLENLITDMVYNNQTQEIYATTYEGLVIVNTTNWQYHRYHLEEKNHPFIEGKNWTHYVELDQINQRLFLSTETEGLKIFNLTSKSFAHWSVMPLELQKGSITAIAYNNKTNELYYDYYNTIWSYNLTDNTVHAIESFDKIYFFFLDESSQQLFIAGNGVRVMNCSTYDIIAEYLVAPSTPYNIVKKIIFEPSLGGLLFLTQKNDGLIGINTTSSEQLTIRRENGLMTNDIASLLLFINNSKPILAIGTPGAISFFSIIDKEIFTTQVFDFQLPTLFFNGISINEKDNQILLGVDEYLCIYDIELKKVIKYYDYIHGFERSPITEVVIDNQTDYWYVGGNQLAVFDPIQEKVIKKYSTNDGLLDNWVPSLCLVDEIRRLFIGTSDGLSILNLETENIEVSYPLPMTCEDILYDKINQRLFVASDVLYIFNFQTMNIYPLIINGQTFRADDIEYYSEKNVLFVSGQDGLFILDLESESIKNHFTYQNAPIVGNWIDGLSFDSDKEMLYVANLGVELYDFAHNFWVTFNDAELVEEELYHEYTNDLCFYQNTLYITLPYNGFTVIILEDIDQDGLFDCTEDWLFGTNKQKYDTDQDGYSDGEELWAGTDPLDPTSYPIKLIPLWSRILIGIIPGISSMITIGIIIVRYSQENKTKKNKQYNIYLNTN